ncbi:hypothetical protein C0993_005106 [Termitomyces sp. T159_Od127]|nr:hypothetical protein C0993_005106 [Termitomyces sp. T159_Od127]
MDQIFCQVMKIPLDEPLEDDKDEEEIEEGQEVDELQSSDCEDLLPNQEKEIELKIPFKVSFNGAMHNLNSITSKTSFEVFLQAVAKRMET